MLDARLFRDGLMWRYPGRNQVHTRELEVKIGLLRAYQVTKMWRIEGSAQNADSH